jgi:quercetin dioxygenase-like cupin family protein
MHVSPKDHIHTVSDREPAMKALSLAGVLIPLIFSCFDGAAAQEAARVAVTPVMSARTTAIGQPIALPKDNPEVRVTLFEIPVGATLPVHKHPFPRYAYVLAGKLRVSDKDDVRTFNYAAGDFIIEMIDAWHYGTNSGTEPVRLLVIDQVEAGQQNTTLLESR